MIVGYPDHAMTGRLRAELSRRGHRVEVIHPDLVVTEVGPRGAVVHPFVDAPMPDAVILTMSTDHTPAVASVAQLEVAGVPVVNRSASVLTAADKFATAVCLSRAGVAVPHAASITTIESAVEWATVVGYPLVAKAADGAEGNNVAYVSDAKQLPAAMRRLRAGLGQEVTARTPLILQEALQASLGRDRRIFVVNGVAQAAMDRLARAGEWRSNLSQGARPLGATATAEEADLAERAATALGLDFTTVDVMTGDDGPVVIEANSYGDVLDVVMMSGLDLIGSMADLAEMRAGARAPGRIEPRPLPQADLDEVTRFCVKRLRDKARELGLDDDLTPDDGLTSVADAVPRLPVAADVG